MSVRLIRNPRRVFVVGGHITKFIGSRHPDFIHKKHPDFGKIENPDLESYIASAVNGTFEATGVQPQLIDKAWIGNFAGELFSKQVSPQVASAHISFFEGPSRRGSRWI
jgi:hypothetical protein